MIWLVLGFGSLTAVQGVWLACLTYLFRRAKGQLDANYKQMQDRYYSVLQAQDRLADRLLPSSSQESGVGEVREVIRTRAKPWESGAWKEIVEAAKYGQNCNVGAAGRRFVIAEVDGLLRKLDSIAVTARIHIDDPVDTAVTERLTDLLEGAGLVHSREAATREDE